MKMARRGRRGMVIYIKRRCRTHRAAGRAPPRPCASASTRPGPCRPWAWCSDGLRAVSRVSDVTRVAGGSRSRFATSVRFWRRWVWWSSYVCLFFCSHWVFDFCSRARRTAIMLLGAKRLRGFGMHQKIIAGARRPCRRFCNLSFRIGWVRFCFASFVVKLSDAALLRAPRASCRTACYAKLFLNAFWIFQS